MKWWLFYPRLNVFIYAFNLVWLCMIMNLWYPCDYTGNSIGRTRMCIIKTIYQGRIVHDIIYTVVMFVSGEGLKNVLWLFLHIQCMNFISALPRNHHGKVCRLVLCISNLVFLHKLNEFSQLTSEEPIWHSLLVVGICWVHGRNNDCMKYRKIYCRDVVWQTGEQTMQIMTNTLQPKVLGVVLHPEFELDYYLRMCWY